MSQTNEFPSSPPTNTSASSAGPAIAQVAAEILNQRVRGDDPLDAASDGGSWLWHGYFGPGKVTLLTSQWKSGKTTFLSVLLSRMSAGGDLAGRRVQAGRVAVITEENRADWDPRRRKLQLGKHVSLFYRPFGSTKPTMIQWRGLIAAMLELQRREGLDLVVVDSLVTFLPGNDENAAGALTECLLPLRDWTDAGMAVSLLHHPRKGTSLPGQAARGSGALASFVDILVEMYWYGDPLDESDRRRRLKAYSRHEATPRRLVVELTADGTDYLGHETLADDTWSESWKVLRLVLEDANERLTQRQILEQWPDDFPKPDRATISRGLKRGVEQGFIRQSGAGRKDDPYRYWLPEKEEAFHPGPNASAQDIKRWELYWQRTWLESLGIDPNFKEEARPAANTDEALQPQSSASAEIPLPAVSEPPIDKTAEDGGRTVAEPTAPVVVALQTKATPEKEVVERTAAPEVVPSNASPSCPESPVPVRPAAPAAAPKAPAAPKPPAPEPELSIEEQRRRCRRYHG